MVEIAELTGKKVKVYSIITEDYEESGLTLFDRFIEENNDLYPDEVNDITDRIEVIAKYTGLRDDFIKKGEGTASDDICALFDKPGSKLRLYFIRFGNVAIILGGGGIKLKSIRTLQEDPKLKTENYYLRSVSNILTSAVQNGRLKITDEGLESTTDFTFTTEDDE